MQSSCSISDIKIIAVPKIGKTKRRLHDRKTEHFKALINGHHTLAFADHVTSTGHSLKWDHFEIVARGRSDTHRKINERFKVDLNPFAPEGFPIDE